jgi:hypothetical protein
MSEQRNGWWPEEENAPQAQGFFVDGRLIATIGRSEWGWSAVSAISLNDKGSTGKPLGHDETRAGAQKIAEAYAREQVK